jgi:glycosyltransferase involved in cell wall biosynthesis
MSEFCFSIIIPTYNSASQIERCIDSIKNQGGGFKYEIIVVDNGSTDNTAEIASKLNIDRIIFCPDMTVYGARNEAARLAKGKILAFIDSDCKAQKNWLVEAHTLIDEGVKIIAGKILPLEGNSNVLYLYDKYFKWQPDTNSIVNTPGGNMFVDKKIFRELGGFIDSYSTASDSLFSIIARSKGVDVIYGSNVIVFHPVDPLAKRIRGELREGKGSFIKAKYNFSLSSEKNRPRKYVFLWDKLTNLFFSIQSTTVKLYLLRKANDVSKLDLVLIIWLILYLKLIGYFSVVANSVFPNLTSKLARR